MPTVRARNEGSLFRRNRDRRWVAEVTMPDGRRRSRSAVSKTDAGALLRDLIRQRDQALEDPRRIRVGPFLRTWLMTLELAPATIRQHEMIVRAHLDPALGRRLLSQLSPADVDAYLASKRLSPQTKRHHRATLRLALNFAMREGYVVRNVAALSKAPRVDNPERPYLTLEQVRYLIDNSRDERHWPLWTLLATTGLRINEALGLAWSDIEGDEIQVRRQLVRLNGRWSRAPLKTRKSRRTIPLVADAVEALQVQKARQDEERGEHPRPIDGLVFTTPDGQPIHSTNVLPPFYRVLRRLGLPKIHSHDLRHTTAAVLINRGVPLPVVSAILGHSSIRVTIDVYGHILEASKREARDTLAEALAR